MLDVTKLRWPPCPYMLKPFKIISRTAEPIAMKPRHVAPVFHLFSCNSYDPPHGITKNLHRRKQSAEQLCSNSAVTAQLISTFVFAAWIAQSFFFLNPKFQASSLLLRLYSPVCVGAGRNPNCWVFSCTSSYDDIDVLLSVLIDAATTKL